MPSFRPARSSSSRASLLAARPPRAPSSTPASSASPPSTTGCTPSSRCMPTPHGHARRRRISNGIPASLTSLTGLKTTYGLVSLAHVVPLSTTLDSIGPLARSVEDAALLTAAMAGADPLDPATLSAPRLDFAAALDGRADLRGMRITCPEPRQFDTAIAIEVTRVWQATIDLLRGEGAIVDQERLPFDFEDLMLRNGQLIAAEAYAVHRAYIADPALPIDPWVRKRMLSGREITAADYIDQLEARRREALRF